MSSFNERNTRPAEKITLAGIAAIIVVGVFIVCVILILAKSLFPSNEPEVSGEVYTGTKGAASSVAETVSAAEESSLQAGGEIVSESGTDSQASSDPNAPDASSSDSMDTSSVVSGETAYLNQTAYLRSSGDENAEPLLSVAAGEEVTVLDRPAGSEYVHVNYIGYDGYIWYGYLD